MNLGRSAGWVKSGSPPSCVKPTTACVPCPLPSGSGRPQEHVPLDSEASCGVQTSTAPWWAQRPLLVASSPQGCGRVRAAGSRHGVREARLSGFTPSFFFGPFCHPCFFFPPGILIFSGYLDFHTVGSVLFLLNILSRRPPDMLILKIKSYLSLTALSAGWEW